MNSRVLLHGATAFLIGAGIAASFHVPILRALLFPATLVLYGWGVFVSPFLHRHGVELPAWSHWLVFAVANGALYLLAWSMLRRARAGQAWAGATLVAGIVVLTLLTLTVEFLESFGRGP